MELGQPVAQTESRIPPGTGLGCTRGNWIPWRKEDLDPTDTVTFTPMPVPSITFPFTDENGYQKIKLDVNDLICWLTCGIPNTINRYFYNAYKNAYDEWKT